MRATVVFFFFSFVFFLLFDNVTVKHIFSLFLQFYILSRVRNKLHFWGHEDLVHFGLEDRKEESCVCLNIDPDDQLNKFWFAPLKF